MNKKYFYFVLLLALFSCKSMDLFKQQLLLSNKNNIEQEEKFTKILVIEEKQLPFSSKEIKHIQKQNEELLIFSKNRNNRILNNKLNINRRNIEFISNEIKQERILFENLNAVLNLNKIDFKFAAFFQQHEYKLATSDFENAKKIFLPLIDSFAFYSNKIINADIKIQILSFGYEDMLEFKQDFNKDLSKKRAQELILFFQNYLFQNKFKFKNYNKIQFSYEGISKGIEKPNPIKNYENEDIKRRLAFLKWRAEIKY